ncbi:HDOD domain-containing protein [Pseudoduganella sp. GCM10020061]|uniref:HDOD domain-containing protein n=1 Tax=Pseudoduganella sp. GCM10020061 TaxID=3317345 RepID=UPI0036320652
MAATTTTPPRPDATLALLWERIRRNGDMPGFTRAVRSILGAMRGEADPEFNMTQTVLSDPILTQKVLRLANSGMYAAFGQCINTVSKAVLVLGTDAIGHLALGLKLIEELSATSPGTQAAHEEMEKAILAGMVAQQVATRADMRDPEEAVVCSMLHMLGRMLVTFYLPEHWTRLVDAAGQGREEAAAPAVLGLALEEIGRAAAQRWGLPRNLLAGMRVVDPDREGAEMSHERWLAAVATMASQCAAPLWADDAGAAGQVRALAGRFSRLVGVDTDVIMEAVSKARLAASDDLVLAPLARPQERRNKADDAARRRAECKRILRSGVSDMRDVLATASPGQMMTLALETVYKGLPFARAVAFLRNRREKAYAARMGLGDGVRELLPAMSFPDAYAADVFHAALDSDRAILIDNARDPRFSARLPGWWKETLADAPSFIILPVCVHGQAAGFLYGEWDRQLAPGELGQEEFALLNDIRTLVARSVERRQQMELAPRALA